MFCPSFSEHIYLSIRSTRPTAPHKYSPPCSSGQEALRRAQTEMDTSIGRTGNGAKKSDGIIEAYLDRRIAAVLKQVPVHVCSRGWEPGSGNVQTNRVSEFTRQR